MLNLISFTILIYYQSKILYLGKGPSGETPIS